MSALLKVGLASREEGVRLLFQLRCVVRRFLLGLAFAFAACSAAVSADTPGEEAVKDAIKSLKLKRAAIKDSADQALLDTAIKDLEERLTQVGKGEPGAEKKDGPFVMPKNWELKFNAGKTRPSYDPKTGELKLAYDFSEAKQLRDFAYDKDSKVSASRGVLLVKGGDELKHAVKFRTVTLSCDVTIGQVGGIFRSSEGYYLHAHQNGPQSFHIGCRGLKEVATHGANERPIGSNQFTPVKSWFVNRDKVGLIANGFDISGKNVADKPFGHLGIYAAQAPNAYSRLTVTGTLDPEWAKEFFADKK